MKTKYQNSKLKKFVDKYVKLSIRDISLAGIFIGLYLISGRFIELNLQGLMHVGITYIFLIMFGIFFGPIKGVFFALIADTFKLLITTGVGQWMWEYEIIAVGIPLMSWGFKFLFNSKQKHWWISMIVVNIITLIGMLAVIGLTVNNPLIHHASHHSYKFTDATFILIYTMAALLIAIQIALFITYKIKQNKELQLVISIGSLVMMIIVVWIWIWGPIAYVRYLQRFGRFHPHDYYTFDRYYKIALWARILKTPVIIPLYTAILIPLYKATSISLSKLNQNVY